MNQELHDFVDGALSGGARLAASSSANERKTFSVISFFDILCSNHTQAPFVQEVWLMHVENGWQSGKEIKNVEGTSTRSRK